MRQRIQVLSIDVRQRTRARIFTYESCYVFARVYPVGCPPGQTDAGLARTCPSVNNHHTITFTTLSSSSRRQHVSNSIVARNETHISHTQRLPSDIYLLSSM